LLLFLLAVFSVPVHGQAALQPETEQSSASEFFVSPLVAAGMYAREGAAIGTGLALGYGEGGAFGIQVLYNYDIKDELKTLELTSIMRLYLPSLSSNFGLFAQINAGLCLFFWEEEPIKKRSGSIVGGITVGWRFLFGRSWFVEPAVRLGYPYIAAIGVGAGFRR
jgi:hypothetical protein